MKAWNVAEMELERHHPRVLGSEDEGRVIVLHLPAGETMQEHQVHERAWLIVAHLAVGTLLWVALVDFAFRLSSVPEAAPAARRSGVDAGAPRGAVPGRAG